MSGEIDYPYVLMFATPNVTIGPVVPGGLTPSGTAYIPDANQNIYAHYQDVMFLLALGFGIDLGVLGQ